MPRTSSPVVTVVPAGEGYRATSDECPHIVVYGPTYGIAEAEGIAAVLDYRHNPAARAPTLVTHPAQITAPPIPVNVQTIPPFAPVEAPGSTLGLAAPPDEDNGSMTLAEAKARYFGVVEGDDAAPTDDEDDGPAAVAEPPKPRRGRPPNPPKE